MGKISIFSVMTHWRRKNKNQRVLENSFHLLITHFGFHKNVMTFSSLWPNSGDNNSGELSSLYTYCTSWVYKYSCTERIVIAYKNNVKTLPFFGLIIKSFLLRYPSVLLYNELLAILFPISLQSYTRHSMSWGIQGKLYNT